MPYKRADSPYWWIFVKQSDGKRTRRSAGTTDFAAAKALEQQSRADAWKEKEWGVNPPRSFEEVMLPYLRNASQHQRSYETTTHRVKALRAQFTGVVMNALDGPQIRAYTTKRHAAGASAATINRELAALSAAINWCNVEYEWALPNPVKGRTMREPEGRVRWLTRAEVESLCRVASKQRNGALLVDFIHLAVNTGCRKEEMLGLEWRRVDLVNRLIYLEGQHTKAGKRRSIPLNDGAMDALKGRMAYRAEACPGSPWVFARATGDRVASIRQGFVSACKSAHIDDLVIHDLRHTCAAHLISAGVALAEVRDLLGHSTIMMTERYAHLAPARVRAAVRVLDGLREHGSSRLVHAAVPAHQGGALLKLVTP
ncbi:site-specific integrase [Pseudomonas cavernicola]|uniref:Site-specific integrase n=1 Tax=Pseudomonas cavernicola TaxID=2320866 RepID=A0A418X835_9PSED|nr:site-specific integrase [Pseudomonas cavernicola]RJG08627.1 site-specific integrase [Pseudomonas cavernicola]